MSISTFVRPDLPDYKKPPVVEVAASVQFTNIPKLDATRLGLLWSRFRNDYPNTDQRSPLPVTRETPGVDKERPIRLSMETAFPAPRLWFLNNDGTRLVQVQSNRLIVNWRRLETNDSYVRFTRLRTALEEAMLRLSAFLQDEQLGTIEPDQVELTYVNHIPAGKKESRHEPLSRFLRWSCGATDALGPEAEEDDVSFRTRYSMSQDEERPARLYLELDSAWSSPSQIPIYVMNLTARGAPSEPDMNGVFSFLDQAHGWIVNGFTSVTTSEAHKLWERTR